MKGLLQYSAECLKREEELWKELNMENNIKAIPEFVKVLYNYFENTETISENKSKIGQV